MSFTDEDFLFAKLLKIIRDVGARNLSYVLYYLYQEHPFSNNGTLSSKDFCSKLQSFNSKKNKLFGNITGGKIKAFSDSYKFEISESKPCKLDISSLFLIISEMALVVKSSTILHEERKKLQLNKDTKDCNDDKLKMLIRNTIEMEIYGKKYEKILNEVKGIKDIRNELFHMDSVVKETLISLKEDFDNCLTDLYNGLSFVFKNKGYMESLKKEQMDTKWIWETKLSVDQTRSLILELQQDDVKKFINTSKKELIKKYKCFEILIPPFLCQENFSNLYLNDIFTPVDLFTKKASLEYQHILTYNSEKKTTSPPAVVISGNAGFGKTTICRKLTNDWCQDKLSTLKNACHYDLLLHIEAKKAKQNSLVDYLKNILLPETHNELKYQKDDIISCLAQCNILFIIDGYDEKSADASKLLDEIMNYFPNKKFLISTRPHYLKQIFNALHKNNLMYLDVNVLGFRQENRDIFIDNVWRQIKNSDRPIDCGDAKYFKKYLEDVIGENLGELLSIPLILLIILYLYISGKNNYKSIRNITFTNLYSDIFDLMKKKVIAAISDQSYKNILSNVEMNIDNLIIDLASECFRLITSANTSSIDRCLIKKIRQKIYGYFEECSPVHLEIIYTSFFLFNPSLQRQNVSKMSDAQLADHLEFLHRTQIEYLAAYYIFNEMNSPDFDNKLLVLLFNNARPSNHEENFESVFGVTAFLIGLLSNKTDLQEKYCQLIMQNVLDTLYEYKEKLVIFWKILSETKKYNNDSSSYIYNKSISDWLSNILSQSKWELHSYEVVSGLKLLAFTGIRIGKLEVNISESMCTYEISNFISTFSQLRSLRSRYKKSNPLLVEFHFTGDLIKGISNNDEILKALYPWGHLEKFTGLLGEEAGAVLAYCYKLRNLYARFETKRALKDCIIALSDKKALKRFSLHIHMNASESLEDYVELNVFKQAKVSVFFEGVNKENLSCVSEILCKLRPKEQLFHTVSILRTNLHHMDIELLFPTIQKLVSKKFTVNSTKDIDDLERLKIANSMNCEFEWLS